MAGAPTPKPPQQPGAKPGRQRVLVSRALPKGFFVLGTEEVVLGRGKECQVVLLADGVSRRHARIWFDGKTHLVADLGSTNGTAVNGAVLDKPRRLGHEDTIGIGPFKLRFLLTEATREELAASFDPRINDTDKLIAVGRKGESRLSGKFEGSGLIEACQLIELSKHSGEMRVEIGQVHGYLRFREGQIVDSRLGMLTGEQAARKALGAKSGQYAFTAGPPPPGALALRVSTLAMDVLREQDEAERQHLEAQRQRALRAAQSDEGFLDEAPPESYDPDELPDLEATRKMKRPPID